MSHNHPISLVFSSDQCQMKTRGIYHFCNSSCRWRGQELVGVSRELWFRCGLAKRLDSLVILFPGGSFHIKQCGAMAMQLPTYTDCGVGTGTKSIASPLHPHLIPLHDDTHVPARGLSGSFLIPSNVCPSAQDAAAS